MMIVSLILFANHKEADYVIKRIMNHPRRISMQFYKTLNTDLIQ